MRVDSGKISNSYISTLSDWEILSAIAYCNKLTTRTSLKFEEEFLDMCFFFFDGDEIDTFNSIKTVKDSYIQEYAKRHAN
jgi:hypothetical protein